MKTTILLDHEPVADGGWLVRAPELLLAEFLIPPAEAGEAVEVGRLVISSYILTAARGI